MNKVLVLVSMLVASSLSVFSGDVANITLDVGYNNNYIVNGVSRAENVAYTSIGAVKSFKHADVYLGGTLIPNNQLDQSHWFVGVGKTVTIATNVGLRADATLTRHQQSAVGIQNSTEAGVKFALENPFVTPYVRGAFDFNLDQNGVFAGAERVQKLPFGFSITPAFEYGYVNDYDVLTVKATLARTFETRFGALTPYFSVGWFDNNFDTASYKWATKEFSGDVVYSGGLKFTF